MRGTRRKKLQAIYKECVDRGLIPPAADFGPKLQWRRFKKMFLSGELSQIFQSM